MCCKHVGLGVRMDVGERRCGGLGVCVGADGRVGVGVGIAVFAFALLII